MITFLFWLGLLAFIIWFISSRRTKDTTNSNITDSSNRDQMWLEYLMSFRGVVRSKTEKHLIETLIEGRSAPELYSKSAAQTLAAPQQVVTQPIEHKEREPIQPKEPIDNTVLLLYFGAFLLIAAAGLFASFSKTTGVFRTVILLVVTATLYGFGLWLYKTKNKLKEAGISFVGTALIIAPLVGLIFYNIVAGKTNGAVIWLVTSVICLGLYYHALTSVRNNLIACLMIGSFVSIIESSILTIHLPSYVFTWGLVGCGLFLQMLVLLEKTKTKEYKPGPTEISAQLLVPLSMFTSILMLPNHGSAQLAVTLVLSGIYYGLLAWETSMPRRQKYSTAAQLALISATSNIIFNVTDSFSSVGIVLAAICIGYGLSLMVLKDKLVYEHNILGVGALIALGGVVLTIGEPWALLGSTGVACIYSLMVWYKTSLEYALHGSLIILIIIPFILGQYALDVSWLEQLYLCGISAFIIGLTSYFYKDGGTGTDPISQTQQVYLASLVPIVVLALGTSFTATLVTSLIIGSSFIALQYSSKKSEWWALAGITYMLPIAYSLTENGTEHKNFAWAVLLGLISTTLISIKTRNSFTRWLVVANILLAPLALGGGSLGFKWEETGYSVGYLLSMMGCLLARAIARGKLLVSSKVPVASFYRQASQAYVFGYAFAALLAVVTSLFATNSRLVTTAVLGFITALLLVVIRLVESNNNILLLTPILAQATLLSALRPSLDAPQEIGLTAIISVALGAFVYFITISGLKIDEKVLGDLQMVALVSCFVGPALGFFTINHSLLLPVSLSLAGSVTFFHYHRGLQNKKELSLGIIITAIHWFLYLCDVTNIHIHTHLLALFLVGFACWRYLLKDQKACEYYRIAIFGVVTVPLALAALAGADAKYGYLLIVEQVAFMTYGIIFDSTLLRRAGLWTGLAAVLYQLRDLGWAFLSLLAIVIITIAVIRLQKMDDTSKK